ncbi:MAG: family 20 glycosylhydrolase, partial [Actinomycetota bacterium]|nr:family 20 glycosylhydrolase [Actinomycetota bacterium]
GLDVVICPEESLYLDYYQSELPDEPLAGRGPTTLADVCAFDPIPPDLDGPAAKRVLGAQVQLWTEHMEEPAMVEYMAFPRTSAFADLVWVPAGGDPAEREARVVEHLARLDVLGVGYRPPSGPLPWQRGGEGRRRRGPNRGEV